MPATAIADGAGDRATGADRSPIDTRRTTGLLTATTHPNTAITQQKAAASATPRRTQPARAVAATRSAALRRTSRDPAQAATPAANGTRSGTRWLPITERTAQTAASPIAVR
jgi:hypothetical protein